MPDYDCYPLWHAGGEDVGNINPDNLPLSKETVERLDRWAKAYDLTLNREDPPSSGFESEEASIKFDEEGQTLWKILQQELGPEYQVIYLPQ